MCVTELCNKRHGAYYYVLKNQGWVLFDVYSLFLERSSAVIIY